MNKHFLYSRLFQCFPVFLFSSVPFFVPAVWTLRPIVLGFVDGTKTVVFWSYLWEKTGYSLVHSDIQVCTYHVKLNWNARDTKVSFWRTVKEMGLDCSWVVFLSFCFFFILDWPSVLFNRLAFFFILDCSSVFQCSCFLVFHFLFLLSDRWGL